jgi:DNA-directed RNA polymerase
VPDFVHSHDAAFMQRFVAHWKTYQRPISTVHDCFGTTLGSVETMRKELNDQWARFYSVDYLARHKAMVETLVQEPVPEPPMLNTLERSRLGENPFLFC